MPFWASVGNIFSESTIEYEAGENAVAGYASSVSKFAVNADGSLLMQTDRTDANNPYGFKSFKRSAHTGEYVGEGLLNGAGTGSGATYFYKAFPHNL